MRFDKAAESFWEEAVPGRCSICLCAAMMLGRDKFCGLWFRPADANALMIVCLGMDSTERAFLRCPKADLKEEGNTGDEGRDAESLGEFCPTVVAAEKEDSEGSLSRS